MKKFLILSLILCGTLPSFADRMATQTYVNTKDNVVRTDLGADITTAKSEAISAASTDATTKANAARTGAVTDTKTWYNDVERTNTLEKAEQRVRDNVVPEVKTYADGKASAAETAAKSHADTVAGTAKTEAIAAAATDAQTKASAAETSAKSYADTKVGDIGESASAAAYADKKAGEVQTNLNTVKADLEQKISQSGVDVKGAITSLSNNLTTVINDTAAATKTAAEADATTKANAAQAAAEATAAADATTKANAAQAAAEATASADATSKANQALADAKTYTDGKVTSVYRFKGSCNWAELQAKTEKAVGDVWLVTDKEGMNYAWTGEKWDPLGGTIDLSSYATKTDVATAKSEAIDAASTDATTKAGTAESNAKTYADGLKTSVETAYKAADTTLKSELTGDIATAKGEAISTAASDAQTKAAAAQEAAEGYTDSKVGEIGESTVKSYVDTGVAGAKTYADGLKTSVETAYKAADTALKNDLTTAIGTAKGEAITAAASDATTKANAAQAAAEATAAADATTKANAAQAAAESTAAADATTKAGQALADAKTYTDGKTGTVPAGKTLVGMISTAQSEAVASAKSYTDTEVSDAKTELIGTSSDASTADTIYGAKKKATETAASAVTTVVGTSSDASSANTVYGAKKKAAEEAAAVLGTSTDASTANTVYGAKKKAAEVLGTSSDTKDKVTVYGTRKYAEDKAATAKSEAVSAAATAAGLLYYTKTEIDTQAKAAFITASNMTESVVKDKVTPKAAVPKATTDPDIKELVVKPNTISTLLPATAMAEGTELHVTCEGTNDRNFKMFLPKEPELLAGMPITVDTEFPDGVQAAYATRRQIYKLPAKVVCEQPYAKLAVLTVTELDDGSDWTPVVTNVKMRVTDITSPKFVTDGNHALEGTSLHCATEFKVVYPTSLSPLTVVTNDLETAGSDGKISGTFYYYTGKVEKQATGIAIDGATQKSWFEIIYKTVNGTATIARQIIDLSTEE